MEEKILLIEDDWSCLGLMKRLLYWKGFEVILANNGLGGLRMAREEQPDIILLDLMLPGIDGFDVCERIRIDHKTAHIPIVIVSAKCSDADKRTAVQSGANAYHCKPIDTRKLVMEIRHLIEQKELNDDTSPMKAVTDRNM